MSFNNLRKFISLFSVDKTRIADAVSWALDKEFGSRNIRQASECPATPEIRGRRIIVDEISSSKKKKMNLLLSS